MRWSKIFMSSSWEATSTSLCQMAMNVVDVRPSPSGTCRSCWQLPLLLRGAHMPWYYWLQGDNNNASSNATMNCFMLLITGCDNNQIVPHKYCFSQTDHHGTVTTSSHAIMTSPVGLLLIAKSNNNNIALYDNHLFFPLIALSDTIKRILVLLTTNSSNNIIQQNMWQYLLNNYILFHNI